MAQAAAATKSFGTSVSGASGQAKQGFQTLGFAGLALGGAIAGGFAVSAKAAIDFESSFAGVRKTVDASEAEFAALAQGMRDLATEIPVNVNELNRIGESAGQLGVQKQAILGFTDTVAKMGVTTDLAGDQAANAFARLHNIMQQSQDDFDRTGSTIVALGNAGASTESEISEFGLRIAGAGQIAGMSVPNVLAIGNALASVGVQAEAGGTATQKVLLTITDAVNTGGAKLQKFADAAGMSAQEFAEQWRADPAEAFTAFVEGLGASGQDAMGILKELGLTDQRLIRSFLSLAGAGDLLRESIDLGSRAWEENSALNEEAGKRFETTASQVQLAKNEINDLAISVGEFVKGGIDEAATLLGEFAGLLNDLPGPLKASVVGLLGVVGVVSLLGGGLLILLPHIARAKIAMSILGLTAKGMAATAGKSFMWVTVAVAAIDDLSHSLGILRGDLEITEESGGGLAVGFTDLAVMFGLLDEKVSESTGHTRQLDDALAGVKDAITGLDELLSSTTNVWATHAEFVERTGRRYHRFAGMSLKDFKEWRGEVVGSLDAVSNALERLSGDMNVTEKEWERAMKRSTRSLTNYADNLETVEKRNIPDALLQQIVSMGTEGAGILEFLAKASDKEFKKYMGDVGAADQKTKNLKGTIDSLPDKPKVHFSETGLDEMIAKVERYSAAVREMPATSTTSFGGGGGGSSGSGSPGGGKKPLASISSFRPLSQMAMSQPAPSLSGAGVSVELVDARVTVDMANGTGWLRGTLRQVLREP